MLHLPAHPARRAGVVLIASLVAVAASLSLSRAPAHADPTDCYGPWTISVDGPAGSGTTQPPETLVVLRVLNHAGDLLPTTCDGFGALSFRWQGPADVDFAAWPLTSDYPSPTNQGVTIGHQDGEDATYTVSISNNPMMPSPLFGTASVTVRFSAAADPGPSDTSLSVAPDPAVANQPATLTAATTSPAGVSTYDWDFGDGTTQSSGGQAVPHVYRSPGDYTASVTVTDPVGKTDSATMTVHVTVPLTPALSLSSSAVTVGQAVDVDGSRSTTDPHATITRWSWDFGDGAHATGPTASYAYAAAATYTVIETVTDSLGRTATASRDVTVQDATPGGGGDPGSTAGPHAVWQLPTTAPVAESPTAFDGTGSTDDAGTIVSYAWSFGDGHTAAGASPRYAYGDGGSYPVTLTVTDDAGRTSSLTRQVTVGYAPPVAAFTTDAAPVVGSPVSFDGSGSSVPAPGAATYAWSFDDGTSATGPTVAHPFPAAGTYPVTLTVTDAAGRTSSVTHSVTPQWGATDLAVSVGGVAKKGGRFAYRVTVNNLGHTGAHGVVLTNTLDPTQRLAAPVKAPAGLRCGGVPVGATGTITCTAGPSAVLAPSRSWVVTFTVKQPPTPRVRLVTETSSVSASNPDPVAANDIAGLSTILGVR